MWNPRRFQDTGTLYIPFAFPKAVEVLCPSLVHSFPRDLKSLKLSSPVQLGCRALCSVLCSSTQRHIQDCAQPVLNSFSKRQPLLSLVFSARVAQQSGNYHRDHLCSSQTGHVQSANTSLLEVVSVWLQQGLVGILFTWAQNE